MALPLTIFNTSTATILAHTVIIACLDYCNRPQASLAPCNLFSAQVLLKGSHMSLLCPKPSSGFTCHSEPITKCLCYLQGHATSPKVLCPHCLKPPSPTPPATLGSSLALEYTQCTTVLCLSDLPQISAGFTPSLSSSPDSRVIFPGHPFFFYTFFGV